MPAPALNSGACAAMSRQNTDQSPLMTRDEIIRLANVNYSTIWRWMQAAAHFRLGCKLARR